MSEIDKREWTDMVMIAVGVALLWLLEYLAGSILHLSFDTIFVVIVLPVGFIFAVILDQRSKGPGRMFKISADEWEEWIDGGIISGGFTLIMCLSYMAKTFFHLGFLSIFIFVITPLALVFIAIMDCRSNTLLRKGL
jgi:hypothetical protein